MRDIEMRSKVYVAGLWAAVVAMVFAVGEANYGIGNPYVVILLGVVAAIAERGRVQLDSNLSESVSLVPTLFAAVLFGPLAAMFVAAASFAPEFREPYLKWASYTASRAITAGATGVVTIGVLRHFGSTLTGIAAATLIGAIVSQLIDAAFAALALRIRKVSRMTETLRALSPLALSAVPLYAPVVAFLAYAYERVSPLTLGLFLLPSLAAQRLFVLYHDQRKLTRELVSANSTLERANLSFASALVAALDARDRYTAGHSAAVAMYARDIAANLGLDQTEQNLAYLCGLVHDIGKIGLAPGLLEKTGPLTLDERRDMQRHSEIGERILANVETYGQVASVVRHHHERVDGTGYPDGLAAKEIPLLSRVIAVADAYNAMTSDRPYREAMPSRVARLRLAQAVDSQFDFEVVAAFESVLAHADESYRLARDVARVEDSTSPWLQPVGAAARSL